MPLALFGQIFSSIQYLDKFDDCVKTEKIKTLITKTDSTFIIEEKGRKPTEYWILNYSDYASMGSKDSLVDLTNRNVYGYQNTWCVIKMSDKDEYYKLWTKVLTQGNSVYEFKNDLSKYWLFIVHRVISKYSFEFEFEDEFFWIYNESKDNKLGKDIERIVYY